jgi:hypothetical protein
MMTDNTEKFKARLRASEPARQFVADWYKHWGIQVDDPATEEAPSYQDRLLYVDGGDVHVLLEGAWTRLEVKHRPKINFTSRRDFSGFPDLIVCAAHTFDRADPKPRLYIHLNQPMTHAAVIDAKKWQRWTIRSVPDRYYGTSQLCYHASWDDVGFINTSGAPPLVEPLCDPPCQTC